MTATIATVAVVSERLLAVPPELRATLETAFLYSRTGEDLVTYAAGILLSYSLSTASGKKSACCAMTYLQD